ncbi:MAG: cyclic pyranopterin monophosphate synthase MoaC [Candidatus Hadarchaeales archaeon]
MAKMVDITPKPEVVRVARASGYIKLKKETIEKIRRGKIEKGDVLEVAKTAAILAIKKVPEIIPLTHPIPITGAEVELTLEKDGIRGVVEVRRTGKTGVEMEALTGVACALLTIWDMVKGLEKDERGQYPETRIEEIRVLEKVKG